MKTILITGMSGAGKSTVIRELSIRGHCAIDTDTNGWCEWVSAGMDDATDLDWIWRERPITALLTEDRSSPLFIAGCKSNQGRFYELLDHVVLLSAPTDVLMKRIERRTTNAFGKSLPERQRILADIEHVLPRLRATSDIEIDTNQHAVNEVAAMIEALR